MINFFAPEREHWWVEMKLCFIRSRQGALVGRNEIVFYSHKRNKQNLIQISELVTFELTRKV